jgi:pantetheine-phosphate adenylyltransferase
MRDASAIYPGSFDPITNGHVDIIERGLRVFDRIVIAVLKNPKKQPLFTTKERVRMIQDIFASKKEVEVRAFDGLLVDFARAQGTGVVIRGLRAISDFEYEFQMALMNRSLAPDIETFFMMPSVNYTFLSSNVVREVAGLGGSVDGLVPGLVSRKLRAKMSAFQKSQKSIKAGKHVRTL